MYPKAIGTPFAPACRLCRNAHAEPCLTKCGLWRNYSHFAARSYEDGTSLPPFPKKGFEKLPIKVQVQILAVYVAAVVEEAR